MTFKKRRVLAILASAMFSFAGQVSSAEQRTYQFDIPSESLSQALKEFSKQANQQVIFSEDLVRGKTAPAVRGELSADDALARLLEQTGLVLERTPSGTWMVKPAVENTDAAGDEPEPTRAETAIELPQPASARSSATSAPEEIIVTARKRQETFLDVPVVISVFGKEALEQYGTRDFYALANRVPGLVMSNNNGVIGPGISLRGIGTVAQNPTMDQSVTLNVDGLQLSNAFAYQAAMFDVGQLEIMKGPQALFYGKNSPAGVISIRSADPTSVPEASIRAGYEFLAEEKSIEAILSGPVADSLKLRLAAYYAESDGYFRNRATAPVGFGVRTPNRNFATDEKWIIRGTALFNPSDMYDARLKLNVADVFSDNGGGDMQLANCPNGLDSFTGLPIFDPNEDCKLNRDTYVSWPDPAAWPDLSNDAVPFFSSHSEFGSFEQNLYFRDLTLTSVTGFYEYDHHTLVSASGTSGVMTIASEAEFYNRQITQEIRLTSDFDSPVNFMLGAFYQDGRMMHRNRIFGNQVIGFPPLLIAVEHDIDIESTSAFGQLTWDITDRLELAGGARWTREKRTHEQENLGTLGFPPGPTPVADPRISSDNISPEFTLTYKPTNDLTLFGSYKRGFKSGSFNGSVFYEPMSVTSFDDEEAESVELGLKGRFFDHQLNVSLAGYYVEYSGLQIGANEITPSGGIAIRTLNAATAEVKGIDFDMTYSPIRLSGLNLRTAVSYTHARYDRFRNAPCGNNQTIAQGCNQLFNPATGLFNAQDLSGEPLARAPEWMISAGFDYEAHVGQGMKLVVGSGVSYASESYTAVINMPGFIQNDYAKINANLSLHGANDRWEVAIIGNNLTDKITAAFCANANMNGAAVFGGQIAGGVTGGPAGDDSAVCVPDRGREVWLRLTVRPF